jgi:hypothetical protein
MTAVLAGSYSQSYWFTSFVSTSGSPDGLLAAGEAQGAAPATRLLVEIDHRSITLSLSTWPWAKPVHWTGVTVVSLPAGPRPHAEAGVPLMF